jgi:hypothetical protein
LDFIDAFLLVALEDIPPLELAVAVLARIAGLDATFVTLVTDQSGLMEVTATTTTATILVGDGIAIRRIIQVVATRSGD